MRIPSLLSILNIKNHRIYLSLLLGIIFGLSLYTYWLIDFLPPTSRRIILFTALASLFGAVGYFFLLEFWVAPRFAEMKKSLRWGFVGLSILIGLFLMFAGTSAWKSPSRYVTFLLPNQTLIISAPAQQQIAEAEVVILFVRTSIGDISYDSMKTRGWTRDGDRLVLTDFTDNTLTWTGSTGDEAEIIFKRSSQGGRVDVSWGGFTERVDLLLDREDKYVYGRDFEVPFYASRSLALTLVAVNFIVISLAAALLAWHKRMFLLDHLKQSTSSYGAGADSSGEQALVKQDWLMIAALIVMAVLLRVFNLENLFPYTDEYAHLLAAKDLLLGAPLTEIYPRSLVTVTLPVAFFFKLFGMELWSARLAGMLFNALAIIPLYWITRKINRPVAVIACFLYATNPWIIAISRNVREYAYYPFYFYWIVYGMTVFVKQFPDRFVILRDWKKLFAPRVGILALVLLLPVIFTGIDVYSTFKVILINYVVFFLFVLAKFDLKNKTNLILLGLAASGFILGIYFFSGIRGHITITPDFDDYLLRYFFPNPPQQWYFDRWLLVAPILLVCAVSLCFILYHHNFIPSFLLALFSASLVVFMLFFSRYFRPRYIFNLQFWYIALMAIGLHGLWMILNSVSPTKKPIMLLTVLVLSILSFNGSQVLLPTFYTTHGFMPITDEYHDNVGLVDKYLQGQVKEGDVLISTLYGSYVHWQDSPKFMASYHSDYSDDNAQEYIYSIIEQNDSGWLVLDARRIILIRALPRNTITLGNKRVEYIGLFADQYLWKWSVIALPPQ